LHDGVTDAWCLGNAVMLLELICHQWRKMSITTCRLSFQFVIRLDWLFRFKIRVHVLKMHDSCHHDNAHDIDAHAHIFISKRKSLIPVAFEPLGLPFSIIHCAYYTFLILNFPLFKCCLFSKKKTCFGSRVLFFDEKTTERRRRKQ
jgi:hypothetical protein